MDASSLINQLTGNISLPSSPEINIEQWDEVLSLWSFSESASEVTSVFQNFLGRLPPYFLAYFAITFLFIIIGLLINLVSKIM